jgi:acyl-CoA synthetase (AMP-forming)/AMP-acid ligase II
MAPKIPLLIGDGLRRNAWKFPVKIAAKDRFREISYADLNTRVNRLANGLLSIGVKRGDAVALSVSNRIRTPGDRVCYAKIGALAIPLDEMERRWTCFSRRRFRAEIYHSLRKIALRNSTERKN